MEIKAGQYLDPIKFPSDLRQVKESDLVNVC